MASMTSVFADWSSSTTGYCIFSYDGSTTSVTINLSGGTGSITDVNAPGGTCNFVGLTPGTTYTASVTANPGGNTLSSNFTTPGGSGGGTIPGDVTGLVATPNYPPLYTHLSWNAASGATSYEIHYGRSDGTYDNVINTGSTSTTSDIFDVQKGKQFYFFVYGVNATGRSASASNVVHAVAGPGRPNDFSWTYTTAISAGQPCKIDHRDWNLLTAKINAFREYYPDASLAPYGFTTVGIETFQAFMYRQAVNATSDMNPFIDLPPLRFTGDDVLAININRLVTSLNSIP